MPANLVNKKGPRGGHTRSFGGCENCRRRHKRCDESKPACLVCERDGQECAGYGRKIFFWPEDRAAADRIRRHLFTNEQQRSMSESLLAHASQEDAARFLQEIDSEAEMASEASQTSAFQAARGPFRVLRFTQPDKPKFPASVSEPLPPVSLADAVPWSEKDIGINGEQEMLPLMFDSPGDQQQPFFDEDAAAAAAAAAVTPTAHDTQFALPGFPTSEAAFLDLSDAIEEWVEFNSDQPVFDDEFGVSLTIPQPPRSLSVPLTGGGVPQDAPFLLNHYVDSVISSMTPLRGFKSPWHTIFFTHAKETLATLTLGKSPDHASLSIFYAILSVSAFNCRQSTPSRMWDHKAHIYKVKALENLKLAIGDASAVPKKFKYKTILMALLTMIQVSIFADSPDQAEYYLFDAEKLIRLRGLTKPCKSRRVRLLHHCYSYPRILYESTFVMTPENTQRSSVLQAVERRVECSNQDRPTFRLGRWSKLEEDMLEVKSRQSGENDLHLERPGLWSATLYPTIYGLPESFLVLLSQVIRLGNEKYCAEHDPGNAKLTWKEFWSRASSLEKCILDWQRSYQTELGWDSRTMDSDPDDGRSLLRHVLEALNHALSIYFYRRIFNLDPSMLREKISRVRDHLLQCDQRYGGSVRYNACLSWPAFTAACEATDHALQASFSMWFKRCSEDTGLPTFATMLSVAEKVWASRRSGIITDGWQEELRKSNIRLFFP